MRSRLVPALFVLAACAGGAGTEDPGSLARRDATVRDAAQRGDVRAADATAFDGQVPIADALSGPDGLATDARMTSADGPPRDVTSDLPMGTDVAVPPVDAGCASLSTESCATACRSVGISTCTAGTWGTCVAPSETCNRFDDDCDGEIDNGFRVQLTDARFSDGLTVFHAGCDGTTTRRSLACNAAVNRYCTGRTCNLTGFGLVGGVGDNARVACVTGTNLEVEYATLSTYIAACAGPAANIYCNAAIHRYCIAQGFVSGFGPIESSATSAFVSCVRGSASVVQTSFSALRALVPSCDNSVELASAGCDEAIHTLCVSLGHLTGYGPVEGAGDLAFVSCLDP